MGVLDQFFFSDKAWFDIHFSHVFHNFTHFSWQFAQSLAGITYSLVYTSTLNGLQTARKWFANQMCVCVDETANLCGAICEWFAYCSTRNEICQCFARTQRELDASGVLCSPQVCGKLINRAPLMHRTQRVQRESGALLYTKLMTFRQKKS